MLNLLSALAVCEVAAEDNVQPFANVEVPASDNLVEAGADEDLQVESQCPFGTCADGKLHFKITADIKIKPECNETKKLPKIILGNATTAHRVTHRLRVIHRTRVIRTGGKRFTVHYCKKNGKIVKCKSSHFKKARHAHKIVRKFAKHKVSLHTKVAILKKFKGVLKHKMTKTTSVKTVVHIKKVLHKIHKMEHKYKKKIVIEKVHHVRRVKKVTKVLKTSKVAHKMFKYLKGYKHSARLILSLNKLASKKMSAKKLKHQVKMIMKRNGVSSNNVYLRVFNIIHWHVIHTSIKTTVTHHHTHKVRHVRKHKKVVVKRRVTHKHSKKVRHVRKHKKVVV